MSTKFIVSALGRKAELDMSLDGALGALYIEDLANFADCPADSR
jgi:hypothetical protein